MSLSDISGWVVVAVVLLMRQVKELIALSDIVEQRANGWRTGLHGRLLE
jgi:hypothetical protein